MIDIQERLTAFAMLGATWVMWLLIILSIIGVAIIFERVYYFFSSRDDVRKLQEDLRLLLAKNDIPGARERLAQSKSFQARIVYSGIEVASDGADAVEERLELRRVGTERAQHLGREFLDDPPELGTGPEAPTVVSESRLPLDGDRRVREGRDLFAVDNAGGLRLADEVAVVDDDDQRKGVDRVGPQRRADQQRRLHGAQHDDGDHGPDVGLHREDHHLAAGDGFGGATRPRGVRLGAGARRQGRGDDRNLRSAPAREVGAEGVADPVQGAVADHPRGVVRARRRVHHDGALEHDRQGEEPEPRHLQHPEAEGSAARRWSSPRPPAARA